jgi:hypothetical protein
LTIPEVAKHIRVSSKAFSGWLRGTYKLPYITVWRLWDFLGLSKQDFMDIS